MGTTLTEVGAGVEIKATLAAELDRIKRENIESRLWLDRYDREMLQQSYVAGVRVNSLLFRLDHCFYGNDNIFAFLNPENDPETSDERLLAKIEAPSVEELRNYLANVRNVYKALLGAISSSQTLEELEGVYQEFLQWKSKYWRELEEIDPGFYLVFNPPEMRGCIYDMALAKLLLEKTGETPSGYIDIYSIELEINAIDRSTRPKEDYKNEHPDDRQKRLMPHIQRIFKGIIQTSPAHFVNMFTNNQANWIKNVIRSALPGMDFNQLMVTILHELYLNKIEKVGAPTLTGSSEPALTAADSAIADVRKEIKIEK